MCCIVGNLVISVEDKDRGRGSLHIETTNDGHLVLEGTIELDGRIVQLKDFLDLDRLTINR